MRRMRCEKGAQLREHLQRALQLVALHRQVELEPGCTEWRTLRGGDRIAVRRTYVEDDCGE
jgi:hypothetical protein